MRRIWLLLMVLVMGARADGADGGERVNVLLITADDMNFDTPAVVGAKTAGVTPNLDRLAGEGVRFVNSHVTVAVCQPSRECLMTGRYPHRNGATGFYPVRNDVTTLEEALKASGYRLGILGKVTHLRPAEKFPWDMQHDAGELGAGRDPAKYYNYVKEFLAGAKADGKPFFLMANSHDPHRPWAGSEQEQGRMNKKGGAAAKAKADQDDGESVSGKYPSPQKIFTSGEVVVPGFLPDLPDVRKEIAQYQSSANRCDQTVGEILRALKESGLEGNTLVMFLSDNGISMPFAKSNCYLTSTRTPLIVRWPGKVKPGVDRTHFVSGIDFMPTVLEATGVAAPEGMDGRSFLGLLNGQEQPGRDRVVTCYNDTSAKRHLPMRCLQDARFGYIYNAWSDGKFEYRAESMHGLTFNAMQAAAKTDPATAERVDVLLHRTPEELYDLVADPNCLKNLAADPALEAEMKQKRTAMAAWMEQTGDPLLEEYRKRIAK